MGPHSSRRALGCILLAACLPGVAPAQEASVPAAGAQAPVLLAAGSLRPAFGEILAAYRAAGGNEFRAQYGPSGKLRQEIEAGRAVDLFASASTGHTEALARQGLLGDSTVFARNDLCVVSTPQAGLYALLDAKALKLSGAANVDPNSTLPYIAAFEDDKADAYIMYCTNAVLVKQALPRLDVLRIPDGLNVRSSYGIAARKGSAEGERLLRFVLGASGQDILRKYGFH